MCPTSRRSSLYSNLKVATLNVRGLGSRRKQYQVKRLLIDRAIDILAIQETKVESAEETASLLTSFLHCFEVFVSRANGMSGGCMLFLRKSVNAVVTCVDVDGEGRFVICDCSIFNVEYRIVNVYAPNDTSARKLFFDRICPYLECQRKIVMLGDFNCVCDPRDRSSNIRTSDRSVRVLEEMVTEFTLQDVATYQRTSADLCYTHYQAQSHARLDRAYVSIELLTGWDDYNVLPVFFFGPCSGFFHYRRSKQKDQF